MMTSQFVQKSAVDLQQGNIVIRQFNNVAVLNDDTAIKTSRLK